MGCDAERYSADWLERKRDRLWPGGREATDGQELVLRVYRATTWLRRAELAADADVQFICCWIGFNSAYGEDPAGESRPREIDAVNEFLKDVADNDGDREIARVVISDLQQAMTSLLRNQYVYQPYWDFRNGMARAGDWRSNFQLLSDRAIAIMGRLHPLSDPLTVYGVLREVFQRMYTLRCQLVHGSASWNGSVNRAQVENGAAVMRAIVPRCVNVMMDSRDAAFWGKSYYPPTD